MCIVKKSFGIAIAAATLSVLALASCSTGGPAAGTSGNSTSTSGLKTAHSSLGTIVVNGKGMTVYVFDKDTANSGKSTCSGGCLSIWPPVTTTSSTPTVKGVTGKIGTIKATNGKTQITLNGLPLYTYTPDTAPGNVTGQAVNTYGGLWWVVAPNGSKITKKVNKSNSGYGY